MNWLDNNDSSGQKNFKFFQAAFLKKLENVITPVFYQTQKIWEERLFGTKIEQSSDENQSLFILKTEKVKYENKKRFVKGKINHKIKTSNKEKHA